MIVVWVFECLFALTPIDQRHDRPRKRPPLSLNIFMFFDLSDSRIDEQAVRGRKFAILVGFPQTIISQRTNYVLAFEVQREFSKPTAKGPLSRRDKDSVARTQRLNRVARKPQSQCGKASIANSKGKIGTLSLIWGYLLRDIVSYHSLNCGDRSTVFC
jgi:hypothetical protein